jgi:PD-(D/E)XK nuclease superfamily protein
VLLTTDQKGAVAEAWVAATALEHGIGVWRPLADERVDLILDLRPKLLRVQCKWSKRLDDVIYVRCYRNRRNADGLLRQYYTRDDVDAFAVYCPDVRRAYLIPFEAVPPRGTLLLRLEPTRNNQKAGIRWAADFEFAATLRALGAIAQLGERCHGMAEVAGSIPAGSTELGVAQTSGVRTR